MAPATSEFRSTMNGYDKVKAGIDVPPLSNLSLTSTIKSPSDISIKSQNDSNTPADPSDRETGDSTPLKMAPSKSSRSRKLPPRNIQLFLSNEDKYSEATSSFQVIDHCTYANKSIGTTELALDCECNDGWDSESRQNYACGEDSDCINRATKMECAENCNCGPKCQNQRFLRKLYAPVTVIKTDKKGYGLRSDSKLNPHDFIFEYIGEVITEPVFRRRTKQYDDEGIKHFYFMSLNKGEFIDATKRGNLGRFCNHSCNPNCYVDKWVVGDKLRMGIFAERSIQKGEELVFNYNVDRYGADPQACYCGESNCVGFIGGKTQTNSAANLSHGVLEALGLDQEEAEYYVEQSRKEMKRLKKSKGLDDGPYLSSYQPKMLDEDGVAVVMTSLAQCKEKWLADKLLLRLNATSDDRIRNKIIRFHGYRILKSLLTTFIDDLDISSSILDVLFTLPRITRNKIQDSGIEEVISKLQDSADEKIIEKSSELLKVWSELPVGYRIPRIKREDLEAAAKAKEEELAAKLKAISPEKAIPVAPTGPKKSAPQRDPHRQPYRPRPKYEDLPTGWFCNTDKATGRLYYYNITGERTWNRPVATVVTKPSTTVKEISHEERIQQIIDNVMKESTPKSKSPANGTPQNDTNDLNDNQPSWKSLPEEKQKKIYENTIHPYVQQVINKYKDKLPRADIKKWGKDISKKLVESDFSKGRVSDPTEISSKQAHKIKDHVTVFFDKALSKYNKHQQQSSSQTVGGHNKDGNAKLSDEEMAKSETDDLKRKRLSNGDKEEDSIKKLKIEDQIIAIPPPPPTPTPPPPAAGSMS